MHKVDQSYIVITHAWGAAFTVSEKSSNTLYIYHRCKSLYTIASHALFRGDMNMFISIFCSPT